MVGILDTAGERLEIDSALPWVAELVEEGAAGALGRSPVPGSSIMVSVEAERRPFDTHRWLLLARGAWMRGGEVVIENVLTSGFDLYVRCGPERVELTYRWRPPARDRVAARALRSRFHLLARAALIQYPALWCAGMRNRVPLHVSALAGGDSTPLVVASSGVGRSTLVAGEVAAGGVSTGDNLAVGDGTTVWGLVEPVRIAGSEGRRMPHGRSEVALKGRVEALVPDAVVVLTRGTDERPSLVECSAETAVRSLIASTYAAGELRRYWSFAATLAAGTGVGAAHPPIANVAAAFAGQLPCYSFVLGARPAPRLSTLLATMGVQEVCV